ncbi:MULTISPECIES: [protein-PII] uridylyltransferase [Spongiibacter]|uniref:[protein-PII] uridylyltransferase n=2 Tax=Spongiibacteraceae TaxID=1706375 RepID=UPI000C406783|nr:MULTISPECIES: [protein-PII] uridylyltransferase [Spongiibacter]MAY37328.1 [protein-PII] uridylyltransferase [Spongiibacter sp.]|tara:strand:+ start:21042 stop:23708 length:2667 start_codon:yes stop_codon:yes gene_type:complete
MSSSLLNTEALREAAAQSNTMISLCKRYLGELQDELRARFYADEPIQTLVRMRSEKLDILLRFLWSRYDWGDDIALIAVGGYGRGELHPHSDIDLLILTDDKAADYRENIESLITLLWDINLEIGHSVRGVSECRQAAIDDITIVTNLMESRPLSGNAELHEQLMALVGPDQIWPSAEFFRAKWDEQILRHRKYANTEYNLEPNIKSSPGGLRDIQMIGWVIKRHFGAQSIDELRDRLFLSQEELDTLKDGQNYLWRLRFALHLITGREEDRMLFDHQRTLAAQFGYEDDDNKLAVERFMQQYYRWAQHLGELNDVLMQHFDETILRACEAETVLEINPRFRIRNGHIEVTNDKVFEKTPSALMEIFVLMAHHDAIDGVRASTIRLIRKSRHLIDEQFRADPRNKRFFLELLRAPQRVALNLRRMKRFGVLGKFIPAFGKIVGQMQHDLFHIYSVDAHTLELIKNISRFRYPDMVKRYPMACRIMQRLPKPELLFLAGLFHDIAKGRGGDHSTLGAVDAREFCEYLGLNRRDTNLVSWLVEKHLEMSSVSQRKDIQDPDVIRDFALMVGDQQHLDYLFCLTIADINATNPNLWTSWRASLMRQLYAETRRALRRGLENPIDKQEWITETQNEVLEKLEDYGFTEAEVRELWGNTGEDYFIREQVDDIVWHCRAIAQRTSPQASLVLVKKGGLLDHEGATQIFVHTPSKKGIFAVLAGAMEQLDLSIQDARIYNSGTGYTLDTFYVLGANGEPIGDNPVRIQEITDYLVQQLSQPEGSPEEVHRRMPRQMRLFSTPTRTSMATDLNKGHTVLEVITPDRPGLLARLGTIFNDYNIRLQNAKIATLGERVEDVFFVTDEEDRPINDPELCTQIQKAICRELDEKASKQAL